MRTLAHLSDLHFGAEDPVVVAALLAQLRAAPPSLIAISGDLTQRATDPQFRAARAFLDALPAPYLVVPGNHDVPLYDVLTRLTAPFRRYVKRITADLAPLFVDEELAVAGINTAHGFTFKDGRVTAAQLAEVGTRLGRFPHRTQVVVAHHPFVLPAGRPAGERVDGAEAAIPALEDVGVELLLTGHLHVAHLDDTAAFRSPDHAIVTVAAGTATSVRRRGESNSYNLITIDHPALTVVQRVWDGHQFADAQQKSYQREGERWRKAA